MATSSIHEISVNVRYTNSEGQDASCSIGGLPNETQFHKLLERVKKEFHLEDGAELEAMINVVFFKQMPGTFHYQW